MKRMMIFPLSVLILSLMSAAAFSKVPTVVVSITPFHDLVSGLMNGVGAPALLVQPGISPHHYSLRPSEVALLNTADIIFWGGPNLESFLVKPLQTISNTEVNTKIIQLDKTPGILLLPTRQAGAWKQDEHCEHEEHGEHGEHGEHEEHGEHCEQDQSHGVIDMHFWLDPDNAIKMSDYITEILSKNDPSHAANYQQNNANLKSEIHKLDAKLQKKLKNVQVKLFLVFHDGYQYFEHHYGLNAVGAVSLHPELPISLERLNSLRETIKSSKAVCIFSEPQFKPKLVDRLVEETGIRSGVLDPLGPKTNEGAEGYFRLLETLADSLYNCLVEKNP